MAVLIAQATYCPPPLGNSSSRTKLTQPINQHWPRNIWDLLVLQLRIGISLVILTPLFSKWSRLPPGIGILLLLCAAPLLALVFLVDRKALLGTLFILAFTVSGAIIGVLLGSVGAPAHNSDRMFLIAALLAALFWIVSIKIKNRYNRYRNETNARADLAMNCDRIAG